MNDKFDIIIIGSGAGGLTAASFAAQKGYKVLVLEQHAIPGGYLHGFKRKGFFFDSAVYSIAGCGKNGYVKYLLDKLGIYEKMEFLEYKSIYRIILPDSDVVLPTGIENFKNHLVNLFPHEKDNIDAIITEMTMLYEMMEMEKFGHKTDPKAMMAILQKWGKKSYGEFIDAYISDEKLRRIFYSLWLFCNLPEKKASCLFAVLMLMIHIVEGTHYIKGGCDMLAENLVKYIEEHDGVVRYSSMAECIIMEDGKARGVRLSDGTEFYSDAVIAGCNAKSVLQKLVSDKDSISGVVKRRIEKLEPALSSFAMYFAARVDNAVKNPFGEANQIFYLEENDNDAIYDACLNEKNGVFKNLLITEIPGEQKDGVKTFNVYSLMSYDRSQDWAMVKKKLSEKLSEKVKKILGGYIKEIVVSEFGTPATFYRYALNEKGSMYGFENTCDPYKGLKLDNKTGIANLFFAGHWTQPGGSVYNAMTSGYNAFELAAGIFKRNEKVI